MGNENHYYIALFLGTKAKANIVSKYKMKKNIYIQLHNNIINLIF